MYLVNGDRADLAEVEETQHRLGFSSPLYVDRN